jgi:hypothetical protein
MAFYLTQTPFKTKLNTITMEKNKILTLLAFLLCLIFVNIDPQPKQKNLADAKSGTKKMSPPKNQEKPMISFGSFIFF